MGLGRASTEMTVALLFTRGFWAVFGVLVLIGFLIDNPAVAIGFGLVVAGLAALIGWLSYRDTHRLPVAGGTVPVKDFECSGCGMQGTLRVQKRTLRVRGGTVRWPFVVCRKCGHEEQVPGRVVP